MESPQEQGHSPFTVYVDHSFHPSQGSSPTKPKASTSVSDITQVEGVLRTKDRKKIKFLVRDGSWSPTDSIRRVFWWCISCAIHKDTASASIYEDMVKEVFGEGSSVHDVTMPTFVDMTNMEHYHISESGIHIAKRVMCILGTTCPDITYAPLAFPLACLLLHYMDESDCYNSLYGLMKARDTYLTQTKKGYEVTKYILKELAKKYCKGWSSYLSKRGLQAEGVLSNWLWWIFKDLPFEHLIRILDCYLVEGSKVLYRVALALINLFYKHSVKSGMHQEVDGDMERALSQFFEEIPVSPDKLLKLAFGIRGLSRKEIAKMQVKSEMYVASLRHAPLPHSIPKSESCESLNLKVSRSFSGPVNLKEVETVGENVGRNVRSNSCGHGNIAMITKKCTSDILSLSDWQAIWQWLPTRITLHQPVQLYTSEHHGTSLMTFFAKIEGTEPTVLVIKTNRNEVFGAYCSDDWANRVGKQKQFFGTGESFVFTLLPQRQKYGWVGLKLQDQTPNSASLFMRADSGLFSIGGGGGVAISLDETLNQGTTQRCQTFDNPPLTCDGDFRCVTIEVFGFGQSD